MSRSPATATHSTNKKYGIKRNKATIAGTTESLRIKEEYRDPIVYFSMVASSEVEPREIIDRVMHEWARLNGTRLQVKDLQFVDSKTVVSIFKVSTATKKKLSTQS